MNTPRNTALAAIGLLAAFAFQVSSAPQGRAAQPATPDNAPRTIAPFYSPATTTPKAPDRDGFLQRWLLLEPISKPNRTNTVFTDSYVRNAFNTQYFPNQFTVHLPQRQRNESRRPGSSPRSLHSPNFRCPSSFALLMGLRSPPSRVIFSAGIVVDSHQECTTPASPWAPTRPPSGG